jgi:hypothetical protein
MVKKNGGIRTPRYEAAGESLNGTYIPPFDALAWVAL